ncbi:protein-S-isoprenylcysteine O-methyltransferase [Plasmodium brasilianum]|uniref:Protein-S-isoprenylcysteine O-methyltransferase n=1 Tax=Plasmodium brasilianum TaxID=5824 RepID=A0ACB9Y1R8_PLABR|nr:protein-S-isoprenylcysteine O-methyltransferase [Plasmodium brasilianum]
MNVGMYIVSAFLLYAGVLNYKPLIYLINTNLYEIIEKKKKFEISDYWLHKWLEYGFNYMDNYGICTYSYYNQIKTNKSNITTPIINEIQGKNKPMKKLLATRYDNNTIISLFLTKRDLLKDSNYSQIIFLRKDTNVKHVLSVYKFGRNKCIFNNTLVTRFIQKWTNKIFSKKYDLNNSLFQKIILKYENFFHSYDIIGNYDQIYNYYLFISLLSLLFSLAGFLLRIFGLIQCSKNFSFYVLHSDTLFKKYVKRKHDLVTWGLYKYMRHPCYTGWFYYALFLQLFLFNIICFILCFIISWTYFYRTIKLEEKYLLECYDDEYRKYKAQTPNI